MWPASHRGWIVNRVPSVWVCDGEPPSVAPLSERDLASEAEAREDYPADLDGTGIPVPPLGRIWLLGSPFVDVPVTQLLDMIIGEGLRRGQEAGEPDIWLNKAYCVDAARDVLSWDQETVNAWRPPVGGD